MKAFVTGGTGFLGTHVIKELDAQGWEIIALVRENSDRTELNKCAHITFAKGDITDIDSLRNGIPEGVDALFHIAGSVEHLPHHMEYIRYKMNQGGTANMVQVALEKNVKRMIYTSTVVTLDYRADQPLTENSTPNLWSKDAYIESKRLADDEIRKGIERGLDVVFMHPSAVFGSYDKATWSKVFLEIERGLPLPFAPPGGCSVCYVREVARAHVTAYSKGKSGDHYLLAGPDESLLTIFQKVAKILRKPGPRWVLPALLFKIYGYTEHFISTRFLHREPMLTPHTTELLCETILSSSDKAVKELGYRIVPLEEMLMDCYHWMVETKRLNPR